ncbi:LytR C-terminal domain-containing protein [Patescibacteria group bacterium]
MKLTRLRNQLKNKHFRLGVMFFVVLFIAGIALYFLSQYRHQQELLSDPNLMAQEDIQKTVKMVSRIMLLPDGEVPTLASVADPSKLTNQPFFTNAQVGDKVLIYNDARKAILYRPSNNLIVEVAPVNIATNTPDMTQTSLESVEQKEFKFVLRNGTDVNGLTRVYQKELESSFPKSDIVDRDNSPDNYDNTMLIDLSGDKQTEAAEVAKILGISLQELPDGEVKPDKADFLIIIGRDKTP